jgi:hypothetical protein
VVKEEVFAKIERENNQESQKFKNIEISSNWNSRYIPFGRDESMHVITQSPNKPSNSLKVSWKHNT